MYRYTDSQLSANRLYLEALSIQYPTLRKAAAEIINLRAILDLPKGTEHFLSDIHGECDAFRHILNNASGVIREKVNTLYQNRLSAKECAEIATLIYYPHAKIKEHREKEIDLREWYKLTLLRLLNICRLVSSKYTRSKVRKALPSDYAYILEELLASNGSCDDPRYSYYENILSTIIDLGQAEPFIVALTDTIKRLIVDKLHIVGDIFDRGPRPDIVMDDLINYDNVDIQWGNHDILWMGAASGSRTCIANALNNAFTYSNLETIEVGYGINLRPLALFASQTYGENNLSCFMPKKYDTKTSNGSTSPKLVAAMHKAIAIILFKLEGHIIKRNPSFKMDDRLLLDKIDYKAATIKLNGKTYTLKDKDFPTICPDDPYRLSPEEEEVMEQLKTAFRRSEKLQRHVDFLFSKGGLYKCCNQNLLFHGCIPMNEDGSFMEFDFEGKRLSSRELLDFLERITRKAYYAPWDSKTQKIGKDFMWFLWCGKHSPLFGRSKICTFERLLIEDSECHNEPRNAYYSVYNNKEACVKILKEFGLTSDHSHIINGHIPVIRAKGESPIKAEGKLIVIDGGFCRAYQEKTGTAGYTLVYNSYGLRLIEHAQFEGITEAIENNKDILSTSIVFDTQQKRIRVCDTDDGAKIRENIEGLSMLLSAYQSGFLKEQGKKDA